MRTKRLYAALAALAAALATAQAGAAPCAGFTDIDDSSPFCPDVDWLKNRAITLGCTPATMYCPNVAVFRLSMSAFMNRLGSVLTPQFLYQEASGAALDLDSPPSSLCATGAANAATYPRAAQAAAFVTARLAGQATPELRIVQSNDNGATWTVLNAVPASVGGDTSWVHATAVRGDVPIDVGATPRFAVRMQRAAGGGGADITAWNCQVQVIINSRSGAAAPF